MMMKWAALNVDNGKISKKSTFLIECSNSTELAIQLIWKIKPWQSVVPKTKAKKTSPSHRAEVLMHVFRPHTIQDSVACFIFIFA